MAGSVVLALRVNPNYTTSASSPMGVSEHLALYGLVMISLNGMINTRACSVKHISLKTRYRDRDALRIWWSKSSTSTRH